jgi:hypothetical protein
MNSETEFNNDFKEINIKSVNFDTSSADNESINSTKGNTQVSPRIAKQLNRVLRNFFRQYKPRKSEKQEEVRHPTHKNLRVCLLRGHKRMIRNCICKKDPKKRMDLCEEEQKIWKELFEKHINSSYSKFKKLSKTKNGPKSEGKCQRSQFEDPNALLKSHNKKYRDDYFSDPEVELSFEYYIEFLFACLSPSSLCDKFDFKCCEINHANYEECVKKWTELKNILKENKV